MTLTVAKLEKFVNRRNKSEFSSNLQFQIDIEACGFRIKDLGDVKKTDDGIYYWLTPYGMLVECGGRMSLSEAYANMDYNIDYIVGQARTQAARAWSA